MIVPIFLLLLSIGVGPDSPAPFSQSFQARQAGQGDADYQKGLSALDARQWDDAVADFATSASHEGVNADAALYWKAYAQNRAGRREDALETISDLEQDYPSSRWIKDAKALEVEVRAATGAPVNASSYSDDDLKLLAVNSLMQSDPDQAVPVLQKLLSSNNSDKVKDRAMFVLAQSSSPQASKLLSDIARSSSHPELQRKAIQYMAMMGNTSALWAVYSTTSDVPVKREILRSMFISGDSSRLSDVARSDKNQELRITAIKSLGLMGNNGGGDVLVGIYNSDPNREVRDAVLNALFLQQNAKALIGLARTAKDPETKKQIVSKLALIHSKEATDYMMEILR